MGKRLRRCYLNCQKDHHLEDLISRLPDEILEKILSSLTMKEAGRSSVLSRRWRNLWKLTTGLNFDASEALIDAIVAKNEILEHERTKYVAWVDQIMELHRSPCLDEFRVGFDLNGVFSSSIDEWVKFSIQKGAKRLVVDLTTYRAGERYTLSQECFACFTSPSNVSGFKRLMSLSLSDVNINGQLLQYLLCNCPLLEQICVSRSNHLVNLEVVGPSLQLKHLEIVRCDFMESLELSAPKLMTFKYFGRRLILHTGDLPQLSVIYMGSLHGEVTCGLVPFTSFMSQLETLELCMRWGGNEDIPEFPELTNLKWLKLEITMDSRKSLLYLSKLIESAPALHKFTLQTRSVGLICRTEPVCNYRPHQCLKHIEMLGSCSCLHPDFAKYLLVSAVNVETIIIHPCYPDESKDESYSKSKKKFAVEARRAARKLRDLAPPGAKFVVK